MLQPRISAPLRAAAKALSNPNGLLLPSNASLTAIRCPNAAAASSPILTFVRHATHQAQGRANGAKDGPGKRLGAKKAGEEYVNPGTIIFRQRGTEWFPGENCAMGRDHCIYATQPGFVKYYKDPRKHPKRQFIGVVFERHWKLPSEPNAARKRRLGLVAVQNTQLADKDRVVDTEDMAPLSRTTGVESDVTTITEVKRGSDEVARLKRNHAVREANWYIGRAAERANITVEKFDRGDRFKAWRMRAAKKARAVEKRGMRRATASGKKKQKQKK